MFVDKVKIYIKAGDGGDGEWANVPGGEGIAGGSSLGDQIFESMTYHQRVDCGLPRVSGGYRFLSARR